MFQLCPVSLIQTSNEVDGIKESVYGRKAPASHWNISPRHARLLFSCMICMRGECFSQATCNLRVTTWQWCGLDWTLDWELMETMGRIAMRCNESICEDLLREKRSCGDLCWAKFIPRGWGLNKQRHKKQVGVKHVVAWPLVFIVDAKPRTAHKNFICMHWEYRTPVARGSSSLKCPSHHRCELAANPCTR